MTTERYERKCFDIRSVIEDAITSLMMLGASKQVALELLMIQAALRIEDNTEVRRILKSIEDGLIDVDDEGDDEA